MKVRFASKDLERLYTDAGYTAGWPQEIVRSFRAKVSLIVQAIDERDIRQMKSLHFEKLKGKRSHERSIRLNKQWRLILEIETAANGNVVVVVKIEDYH